MDKKKDEKPPPFKPKIIEKKVPKFSNYKLKNGQILVLENKPFPTKSNQLELFT